MGKFSRAFSLLGDYLPQVRCSYLFAFFVLDTGLLTFQWLHLTGDRPRDCSLLDAAFSEGHENSAWETMVLRAESPLKRSATKQVDARNAATGKGSRQGFLALIPKVMSDSFVHVSVRGGSYRIRIYNTDKPAARPKALTIAEYPTFDTLRKSEQIVQWIPATSEDLKHNVDDQPQYWCDRIRKLNVKYSSQIDDTRECIH